MCLEIIKKLRNGGRRKVNRLTEKENPEAAIEEYAIRLQRACSGMERHIQTMEKTLEDKPPMMFNVAYAWVPVKQAYLDITTELHGNALAVATRITELLEKGSALLKKGNRLADSIEWT